MSKRRQLTSHHNEQAILQDKKGNVMGYMRAGILPPPQELERYENLCPGITEKIMNSYEIQVNHRVDIENKVVISGIKNSARGQVFAFILALIVIIGGFWLIYLDKDGIGIAAIITAVSTLVGAFLYTKKQQKDERIKKSQANPE